jgi:exopolyphosphatase/guanosine-5'-triphosphate,3'-diphosphate pyrophosphatase
MRVAAVDCGTNSLRWLVADTPQEGPVTLKDVERGMRIVRLGQGVDQTGRFADDALERTFAAVDELAELFARTKPDAIGFVATSATRDAANRDVFLDGVEERLGVRPEVLSGEAEAEASFLGAATSVVAGGREKLLVVDLGGGSTECVLGDKAHGVIAACSVDMGAVRFTERLMPSDPSGPEEIAAAEAAADALLDQVAKSVNLSQVEQVIGVAGTNTTVTAHALDLPAYDSKRIDGTSLPIMIVEAACSELAGLDRERIATLPYVHPGRVDVLSAGAVIWRTLLRRITDATQGRVRNVVTSEHDILDGTAITVARGTLGR